MSIVASHSVEGHVSSGFEAVREAFDDNFARRDELGGACCVYHRGEKVVDLWGGIRNRRTGEPWERDTMVIVHPNPRCPRRRRRRSTPSAGRSRPSLFAPCDRGAALRHPNYYCPHDSCRRAQSTQRLFYRVFSR